MILSATTKLPRTINVANLTTGSAGQLIAAPGAGKNIVLVDLMNGHATTTAVLETASSSGDVIAQVPGSGAISLNAPIKVAANTPVHVTSATKFTATYLIEG